MAHTLTITDTTTDATVTVAPYDIVSTISPWYEDAPPEVFDAVRSLEDAARRGESTDELAQFLAVTVEWNA